MKKFILFALLLSVTAIGNNTFAAKMSQKSLKIGHSFIEKTIEIENKEGKTIDEQINSEVNSLKNKNTTCYLIFSISDICFAEDGTILSAKITIILDCFEPKPQAANMC